MLGTARVTPSRAVLSSYDVIALEIAYTTIMARYYKPVEPAALMDGARNGLVAYLKGRGIAHPVLPADAPHADRWTAENAIDRDVALAIARYATRVRSQDAVARTIAGELAVLHDPYSVLFDPSAYKKFVGFLDSKATAGIGAELDVDPQTHAVRVVDVFPGSPAEAAGLMRGDVITAIDGRAPDARVPGAVAVQLRGAAGTTVRIAYSRDGEPHAPLAVVRKPISAPDVLARMLPGNVAYIRIRSFGARSPQQFDAALARAAGAKAYVIDLRADGGGYRDAAIAIASHFVDGTVVTTQERGAAVQTFAAKPVAKIHAPLAVLVDANTASASEIVAGAIQDARAGTLVGEKTFGKGLVQETFPLPSGAAIKLTTASYRTPAGRDIEGTGLQPDVVVAEPSDAAFGVPGRDAQLDRALSLVARG